MRRNYGLTAFPAVAALVMSVAGCQEEPGLASLDDLAFDVRIETVGSNDVTALVRHNGTDDITYYAFCYRDFTQGETLAVENAVADLKASGTSATEVLHTGSSASVTCSGLQSSTMYRLVVVGLDEDYNVYGTPASVYFNTVEGVVLYEENPDWIVSYQGKQTASDNSGYGDVIQVTLYNTENSFFLLSGIDASGTASSEIYFSRDGGINWSPSDSLIMMPQEFKARGFASIHVDADNFIYLFGGKETPNSNVLNEIWRGRINRLGF